MTTMKALALVQSHQTLHLRALRHWCALSPPQVPQRCTRRPAPPPPRKRPWPTRRRRLILSRYTTVSSLCVPISPTRVLCLCRPRLAQPRLRLHRLLLPPTTPPPSTSRPRRKPRAYKMARTCRRIR
ncbi:hypothetical protein BCR44DRAFT_1135840 [Catenaria anguillulae PL171]|uniref:Uncharacterized protein n=1 Tax=Catenaria anguillulae PL171 TaxID=765915 RepID=A0A1Y2H409_9FUNG|nr:hypothetical protein BCR44DRAFT_1135840 [Catenaria anguillulae PL171]